MFNAGYKRLVCKITGIYSTMFPGVNQIAQYFENQHSKMPDIKTERFF